MKKQRSRWVIGNWKMNGSLAFNQALIGELSGAGAVAGSRGVVRIAVCPPFPYLPQVSGLLATSDIELGAQDVAANASGAYTGQVAAPMLREFGVSLVIVGHSERRTLNGDTDDVVAAKLAFAIASGLTAVVCVGETLAERDSGDAERVVGRQIAALIEGIQASPERVVVAYEPVWAIGTGRTASVEVAQEMHRFIRSQLAAAGEALAMIPILYGGSVKAGNAAQLGQAPDIDGALVGGASLDANEFLAVIQGFCASG